MIARRAAEAGWKLSSYPVNGSVFVQDLVNCLIAFWRQLACSHLFRTGAFAGRKTARYTGLRGEY